MSEPVKYTAPPTVSRFIRDYLPGELFKTFIIGPFGSGKTVGNFMKLVYMASLQKPGPDGIRRTRAVVVRNTNQQLTDTTLSSWFTWFKDGPAGHWFATDRKFLLKINDIECEVLFRPLDTPQDVARVLSLEITFVILDEYVEIPQAIVEALEGRCGRYPAAIDGGATNWGLWGASNPATEDNWWHDYLHGLMVQTMLVGGGVIQPGEGLSLIYRPPGDERNTRYFLQPSGFSPDAENVQHLPGKEKYYLNLAKNKSEAWIKQYIEAEWGFSHQGKPVIKSFNADVHVSRQRLRYDPMLRLVAGYDPGMGGSAMIFGQEDWDGRLMVLGELIASGVGASRFLNERLKPFLARNFPDLPPDSFMIAPDPASSNRTPTDESTIVKVLRQHYPVSVETNNRLPLRVDAIEHYTSKMVYGLPGLVIDGQACPTLVRALKGGWRYKIDKNSTGDHIADPKPEKNAYSHPGDAVGYLARYFHKHTLRNERWTTSGAKKFTPPPASNNYHFR